MKPVDMISLHDPDNGAIGDCFRAAIASLLELRAVEVPHFCEKDWGKEKDFTWFSDLQAWLAPRGLAFMEIGPIPDEFHGPKWFEHIGAAGFDVCHTMSGVSPRGFRHTVVARNGVMVHDPHPDRTGLVSPGDEGWLYGFLIATGRCAGPSWARQGERREEEADAHDGAMKRCYLAGPMRGYPEFNFPAFFAAAAHLRRQGYTVWSPAENDVHQDGFDPAKDIAQPMRHYMKRDLPAVLDADFIAVLPGWEKSQGAMCEVMVARACGIPVLDAATLEPVALA